MSFTRYNVFLHEIVTLLPIQEHRNAIGGGVTVPNIKSAKKRVALSRIANEKNKAEKSILKTSLKKFDAVLANGSAEEKETAYKAAVQKIDQAVKKGILHKNTAARKKSSITLKKNASV